MKDLSDYLGKKIVLIDVDGKRWEGMVECYNPFDDFGEGEEESIAISVPDNPKALIEFEKSEIASIEIV